MSNGSNRYHGILSHLPPVTRGLLLLNLAIYFTDLLWFDHAIRSQAKFSIPTAIGGLKVWQFISFQFMHGNVGHLLMNGIGLYFFAPVVERAWGGVKFLGFYLICGIGGATAFCLLAFVGILPEGATQASLVGASGGIYGLAMAVAVLAPHARVQLLFPPITLSMRQLALAMVTVAVAVILFHWGNNAGGEAGHLGGAAVGFLLAKRGAVLGLTTRKPSKKSARYIEAKIRPRTVVDLRAESHLDAILDKISREGFQSLSEDERDLLHREANKGQD